MKLNSLGVVLFVINLLMLVVGLRTQDDVIMIAAAVSLGALAPSIIIELIDTKER